MLAVAYSAETAHLIGAVERLAAAGLPRGTLAVCRVHTAGGGVTAEPLSLVHPARLAPETPLEALHFSQQSAGGRVKKPAPSPTGPTPPAGVLPAPAPALQAPATLPSQLADLRSWLVRQAERGTGASSPGLVSGELLSHHHRLRDIGLDVFPICTPDDEDPGILLLRSHFLVQQVSITLTSATPA